MQILIALLLTVVIAVGCFLFWRKRKNQEEEIDAVHVDAFQSLLKHVKTRLALLARDDDIFTSASAADYEIRVHIQEQINEALEKCVYGYPKHCNIIRGYIRDIVATELKTLEDVNKIVDFSDITVLPYNVKWEILVFYLKRSRAKNNERGVCNGRNIISYLTYRYDLDKMKTIDLGDGIARYKREFSKKDLNQILAMEMAERNITITYPDALDILSILLFQRYAGLGIIDTLRYLDCDGFNFGTSGHVRLEDYDDPDELAYTMTNSVWVQANGHWVHYEFLDFGNEHEMARVINQLTTFGSKGQMVEKTPYTVVDDYKGSRIMACRPPAAESWGCFVRKFDNIGTPTLKFLLYKDYVKNAELPATLIQFLMKARQTTAFTGQQNTGKTTLMKAAIKYIPVVNVRVLEMSFELALREIYPEMNIFTVKPTETVTSSQLQDLLKKSDGWLSMVGEVAEDIVAARMIQFSLIGSDFTMFSHHGKNDIGLINGLTNSLVASGEYSDHEVAASTVLDAIKHNVHLGLMDNKRYIEYISEIVKLDENTPYPDIEPVDSTIGALLELVKVQREYATRRTDRVRFESRYIVKFNPATMSYEPGDFYSPEMIRKIMKSLTPEDRTAFLEFYKKWWRPDTLAKEGSGD